MKTGQIMTSPEWRWYEPQHAVLGSKEYFVHAWGSIYVLSGSAASSIARTSSTLRYFANEGQLRCTATLWSTIVVFGRCEHAEARPMETLTKPSNARCCKSLAELYVYCLIT